MLSELAFLFPVIRFVISPHIRTFFHEDHFLPNAHFVLSACVWRRLLPTSPGPTKEDSSVLKMQRGEWERRLLLCLVWGQGTCSCCLWRQTCCCFSAAMAHFSGQNSCQSVNTVIITCLEHRGLCMEKWTAWKTLHQSVTQGFRVANKWVNKHQIIASAEMQQPCARAK